MNYWGMSYLHVPHSSTGEIHFYCCMVGVVEKGGYGQTRTWTRTFLNAVLHCYNSNISYLVLILQQHSLSNPGVDLSMALIYL